MTNRVDAADFDGDGLTDLLVSDDGAYWLYRSTGTGLSRIGEREPKGERLQRRHRRHEDPGLQRRRPLRPGGQIWQQSLLQAVEHFEQYLEHGGLDRDRFHGRLQ